MGNRSIDLKGIYVGGKTVRPAGWKTAWLAEYTINIYYAVQFI